MPDPRSPDDKKNDAPGRAPRHYLLERHRQVIGDLRSESPDAGSQAAFNPRVMSSQIQWASALAWR